MIGSFMWSSISASPWDNSCPRAERHITADATEDLKIGEFSHGDAGQMNFYLNWAKKEAKLPGEKDPMGIILCSGKNEVYAEYALGGMNNKIFVPEYRLKFPKPDELKREIQKGRSLFLENQARRKTF